MEKVDLRVIENEDVIISYWPMIKEIPLVGVENRDLLVKCLSGKAALLVGNIVGGGSGIAIVERVGDSLNLLGVNAKNSARELMPVFYSWAKSLGIKRISMMSTFDRKSYEKLFEVRHITSVYEKDLTQWEPQ